MKAGVHEGLRRTAALAAILFLSAGAPYASIVHAQDAQGYVESYVPADIAGSAAGSPYADNIASDIIEPPVISGALMAGEALLETPEGSEPTRTRLRITRGTTDIGKAILPPSHAVAFGYVGNVDVALARKLDRIRATLYCVLHR